MPLKNQEHELCEYCGAVAATAGAKGIMTKGHHCDQGPPGPQSPPRTFLWGQANFVTREGRVIHNFEELKVLHNLQDQAIEQDSSLREKVVKAEKNSIEMLKKVIIDTIKTIPEDDRMDVFNSFCVKCGTVQTDPPCQCWNDE